MTSTNATTPIVPLVRIPRATELLRARLAANSPVFAWGKPGVGKSDMVRQIANADYDGNLIDFRAILRDPIDLRGLPDISGGTTKWLTPNELPNEKRDGPRGILFLDELNAAPPAMQAACFGLVLDRKLGDYRVPDGWRIVAAGNRQSDRGAAQAMPTPLANRFAHLEIQEHADDFAGWLAREGKSPILGAFVRFRPGLLHDMTGSDRRAFPTPRSWASAEKFVEADDSVRLDLISMDVGSASAGEFEAFIRVYQGLPSVDLVLQNPTSAPLVKEQSAKFAMTSALARKVTARNLANAMAYVKRLNAREFDVMLMIDAVARDPGLSHTNEFVQWSEENEDITIPMAA